MKTPNYKSAQRAFAIGRNARRRTGYIRERVQGLVDDKNADPDEYASEQVETTVGRVRDRGVYTTRKGVRYSVQAGRNLFRRQRAQQAMRVGRSAGGYMRKVSMITMKTAVAGAKALAAAVFAGGWVAVLVVIMVSLIAGILLSPMGIFFSGKSNEKGYTIPQVVREIDKEYRSKVEELCASMPHDEVEMAGERAPWKEILAVYAIKGSSSTHIENTLYYLNEDGVQLLKDVFWEFHGIDAETKKNGTTGAAESRTALQITVTHTAVEEVAQGYGFTQEQIQMLMELLGERFDDLWRTVLYGGSDPGGDLVAVALSQVGNVGGEPYWSWYGFSTRVEWCACFVSWCAEQCGYLDAGIIPKFSGCIQGSNWFKERGQWQDRTYEPQPGDIIFFDWAAEGGPDGLCDHVGIVERVEHGKVYTVEGNSGDMCRNNSYPSGYEEIYGYGTIDVK